MMAQTLEEFLADSEVPADIRALVKSRLDPDPQWVPEDEEE
jgi:hypothetical protein